MEEKRHLYEYDVDTASESAAAHVIRLVGRNKRVLELGCGPGSITKILAGQGNCRITGVELDPEAIAKVAPYCEQVLQADLNSSEWPTLLDGTEKFDAVVAADVLEHLYDPWKALQEMAQFIDAKGHLVISLPHAGHAAVLACLINGDFEYRDWGLLDRTHIRFFGPKNIEALFAQAGLKIVEATYVTKRPEETELKENWANLSKAMQDTLMTSTYAQVYQVVVKAVAADGAEDALSLASPEPARLSNQNRSMPEALISGDSFSPKLIAFYLPQFHPTPENDLWWGRGFTEWTNVTQAEPVFEGHYQPHLPGDFGFYDLRVRQTRRDQIKAAKAHGIDGFCYHYYWFSGKRVLHLPIDDMLSDPESDMPFCLCWANENWTRRWDGNDQEILIAQRYLPNDDFDFIQSIVPFFKDRRYIRLDGKPFLIVYRPQHLPDARKSCEIWRDYCRINGLGEIYVCAALTHGNEDFTKFGFDSGLEFPPHNLRCANINDQVKLWKDEFSGNVMQYASIARYYLDRAYDVAPVFKTVFPSWDNTARAKDRAFVVLNGVPENYEYWLAATIDVAKQPGGSPGLVFVNAWNEWAEGCHLEPDQRFGNGFLQATLNAKNGLRRFSAFPKVGLPHQDSVPAYLSRAWAQRKGDVDRLSKELAALYASTSWRLTRPLRSVKQFARYLSQTVHNWRNTP